MDASDGSSAAGGGGTGGAGGANGSSTAAASAALTTSSPKIKVHATRVNADGTTTNQDLAYEHTKAIGQGSFGTVYSAHLCTNGVLVAIKKVLQDRRFKNRELSIMKRLSHPNIVQLLYYFYSSGSNRQDADVYLNLVMEYVPENVYRQIRYYHNQRPHQTMPLIYVKLYIYQLFRAVNYIHKDNICHRDIKPQNLLCNPGTGQLKLCDFGSAKQLVPEETNVAYICSRYYRAPELILCAVHYTCAIDVWSCGCVLGELLLNQPLFPGETGVDQLVEIIKILGTPNHAQIEEMNPGAAQQFRFPPVRPHPWNRVFRPRTPQSAISLATTILEFTPLRRIKPVVALHHEFFKELRDPKTQLPNGNALPYADLFDFTADDITKQLDEAEKCPNGGAGPGGTNPFPEIYERLNGGKPSSSSDVLPSSSNVHNSPSSRAKAELFNVTNNEQNSSNDQQAANTASINSSHSTEEKCAAYISMLQPRAADTASSSITDAPATGT